jgi:hypothetical protein
MNERIRELAEQAGAGEWGDSVIPAMMDIEKFAELIVRECLEICKERERPNLYGVREVETAILKHFGVE